MANEFENTVSEFMNANGLLTPPGKILVAVSGGADSMALMHILHSLKTGWHGHKQSVAMQSADIVIAHINHQLRGKAADEDEAFVIRHANTLGFPVITRRIAVTEFAASQKLSIETAARQLRIEALIDMARESGCSYIATAHHKNDNAETIVHRLLRGTGFRGLAGIRPLRKLDNDVTLIRPLLCVTREQIIAYLNEFKISWRHDHTNDNLAHTRNFIRHSLLPKLQGQSSNSLIDLFDRLSMHCRGYVAMLDRQADELLPDLIIKKDNQRIELDPKAFASVPVPLKAEVVRRSLLAIGSGERDLSCGHYERILEFAQQSKPRKCLSIPHRFIVRTGKTLVFEKSDICKHVIPEVSWKIETQVFDAKSCDINSFKSQKTNYIEWFDADKVIGELKPRHRRNGDVFWPIGLEAPKKIGKFLTDARINDELRKSVCIVEDDEKVIWLMPVRASEQTKITAATKRILQITCSPIFKQ